MGPEAEIAAGPLGRARVGATAVQAAVALVGGGFPGGLLEVGFRRMGEAAAERTAPHDEILPVLQHQPAEHRIALRTRIERSAPSP